MFIKSIYLLFLAFFACSSSTFVVKADDAVGEVGDLFQNLKESYYDNLPANGKFATGAVAGFAASRFTVNRAVGALKFAGAAFIASEVIERTGVFDKVDLLSDENEARLEMAKRSLTKTVKKFSTRVKNELKPAKIEATINAAFKQEKMCTMGFASGAFAGLVI
mmetsp:Transcript_12736/g.16756  ORF Transcript_12736/g.16756 Transcript_12736/m.16756 type:complete len:164 (+) Transcript_12736:81-572(+)|eukprot:CAMPEP_0195269562 /NCGR_PEP_ID=MMETSP0706-20130129/13838_1 /TAXON_ID=33640 /ORGANISM="Asterionellopsis glacialis, Strain CCMP134" /LENGTH=163 /DNA_ID=CAMNT_0040324685 /DNA_START=80 /DNA_END=571 /DNA_ORIENTATION=-